MNLCVWSPQGSEPIIRNISQNALLSGYSFEVWEDFGSVYEKISGGLLMARNPVRVDGLMIPHTEEIESRAASAATASKEVQQTAQFSDNSAHSRSRNFVAATSGTYWDSWTHADQI
jgi:hypothetical protein